MKHRGRVSIAISSSSQQGGGTIVAKDRPFSKASPSTGRISLPIWMGREASEVLRARSVTGVTTSSMADGVWAI